MIWYCKQIGRPNLLWNPPAELALVVDVVCADLLPRWRCLATMEAGAPEADESVQAFGERIIAMIEPQICDATSTIMNCNILVIIE